MLGQKQELGHMSREKAASVKDKAFIPYGQLVNDGYLGSTSNAKAIKAKDQRVQVNLASKASPEKLSTESRTNFKSF